MTTSRYVKRIMLIYVLDENGLRSLRLVVHAEVQRSEHLQIIAGHDTLCAIRFAGREPLAGVVENVKIFAFDKANFILPKLVSMIRWLIKANLQDRQDLPCLHNDTLRKATRPITAPLT